MAKTSQEKQDAEIGKNSRVILAEERRTDPNCLERLIERSKQRMDAYSPIREKYIREKEERVSPRFIHTGK